MALLQCCHQHENKLSSNLIWKSLLWPHLIVLVVQGNPEDRLPVWARNNSQPHMRAAPAAGPSTAAPVPGRRRATMSNSGSNTRPVVSKVDSWQQRRPGPAAQAAGIAGSAPAVDSRRPGGGAAAAQVRKTEYVGPDGDLVANLERDMLDSSPGIRCEPSHTRVLHADWRRQQSAPGKWQ